MNSVNCYFDKVPDEVIVHMTSFFSPKDLVFFGRTCKRLYQISEDDSLWKLFCVQIDAHVSTDTDDIKPSHKQIFKNSIVTVDKKVQLLKELLNILMKNTIGDDNNQICNLFKSTSEIINQKCSKEILEDIYALFLSICNSSSEITLMIRDYNYYCYKRPYSILEKIVGMKFDKSQRAAFEKILEDLIIQELKRETDSPYEKNPHVTIALSSESSKTFLDKYLVTKSIEAKQTAVFLLQEIGAIDTRPENLKSCALKELTTEESENGTMVFLKVLSSIIKAYPTKVSITLEKSGLRDASIPHLIDVIQSGRCSFLDLSENEFSKIGLAFLIMANHNNPCCKLWLSEEE